MNIIDAGLKFRNPMDIRKSTERLVLHHAAAGSCTGQVAALCLVALWGII